MGLFKNLFKKNSVESEMDIMIKSILEGQKNLMDMMIAHNEINTIREEKKKNYELMKELIVQLDEEMEVDSVTLLER